jgi:hypothetical protein
MAVIGLVSAKGSPGVTTAALALALAWPRPAAVAECDPAGGDVLAGFFAGAMSELGASRSLLGAASALRHPGAEQMARMLDLHLTPIDLDGTRWVLPGPADPAQAAGLARHWPGLAELFAAVDPDDPVGLARYGTTGLGADASAPARAAGPAGPRFDVLADCGRLGAAAAPRELLRRADLVVLVARSSLVSVRAAAAWAGVPRADRGADAPVGLRAVGAGDAGLLLVGEGRPYGGREIAAHLGLPLLGVLAWDPKNARVISDGAQPGWRFATSALMSAARTVAAGLLARARRNRTALVARPAARAGRGGDPR